MNVQTGVCGCVLSSHKDVLSVRYCADHRAGLHAIVMLREILNCSAYPAICDDCRDRALYLLDHDDSAAKGESEK